MKLIITENFEEMSRHAAVMLAERIAKGLVQRTNIAITGGKTPVRMYELVRNFLPQLDHFSAHFYNFDEIPVNNGQDITMKALNDLFYNPNKIPLDKIHVFNQENYQTFEQTLMDDGGLDTVILGLGEDGHFCGNLPGSFQSFDEGMQRVDISKTSYLNDRVTSIVGGKDNTPGYYVTFGPKTIMNAKEVIMIVNGEHKADMLNKVINGPVKESIPSSIFQLHPNFKIVADKSAASKLNETTVT